MSQPIVAPTDLCPVQFPLACRLRHRQLRRGFDSTAGEIELQNVSEEPIEIDVKQSLLQYLDIIVADATGRVISDGFYGDIFSPMERPYRFRLEPGQQYVGPVNFVGNVPNEKRLPGKYTVQAVYQYEGLKAVSEPFLFELPPCLTM